MNPTRRALLGAGAAALAGCRPASPPLAGGWVGADAARGHRVRDVADWPAPSRTRRAGVVIVGAGIAGLAAARALIAAGVDDVQLLELEDAAGGNSRGHTMAGMRCPLGAHYLPVPGPHADDVAALLVELGAARHAHGRLVVDERHLCHSPQERLFVDGAWVDGLLPPAPHGSAAEAQYRRFAARIDALRRDPTFVLPVDRGRWTETHRTLDGETFAAWLAREGFDDPRLRWYLDYACRDDYGAGADTVSAWAGVHYFASRHGFSAGDADGDRDAVLTWPEGNAWLAERLAAPHRERLHAGRVVGRVEPGRDGVRVLARAGGGAGTVEVWQAHAVVIATPLFVAGRLLAAPPAALVAAARAQRHAPWLVANLQLDEPLVDRPTGAAPAWDNVVFDADPRALGYVDAMHQSTRPHPGPTVLTAYWCLPVAQRAALLAQPWQHWAHAVIDDLARVHPDLPAKVRRADLARYGHAMNIPVPGVRSGAALAALRNATGRVQFAHADLSGYSVFEEAWAQGVAAAARVRRALAR